MILYLDASALVKRYVTEIGSTDVNNAINDAQIVGTSLVSRAEVSAALAKTVRLGILAEESALAALQIFKEEWPSLMRIQVTEMVVALADRLAWTHNLRGYDSIHLASAIVWQESLAKSVTMATFDRQLWLAANNEGLPMFPDDLSAFLHQ